MKKLIVILVTTIFALSIASSESAAFTVAGSEVYSASADVTGTPSVTVLFSAVLKKISDDEDATSVLWTGVNAGSTSWLRCDQYIAVEGYATYADWGIQVYTDNENATIAYTGTGNPAGLVREDNTIFTLSMCWRIKTKTVLGDSSDLVINQRTVTIEDEDIVVLDDGTTDDEYYPWFFMMDKGSDMDEDVEGVQPFSDFQAEATFIGSNGYHHAPGDVNYATPPATDQIYNIYLGANFTTAVPGSTYSTDTITVEMYHL